MVSTFRKSIFQEITWPETDAVPFDGVTVPIVKSALTVSLSNGVPVICWAIQDSCVKIWLYIPVRLAAFSVKNEPPDWILFKVYSALVWSVPDIAPKSPTEKIWLLYTTLDTVVVLASFAAVMALWIQEPCWPSEQFWSFPVLFATPSVNKTILLDVTQSKVPWVVSSLSAFLIPSWILVLPFAVNAFIAFIKSACPVDNVNGFTIVAVLLYFTIETLFFPVGLLAAKNILFIKSTAASWA